MRLSFNWKWGTWKSGKWKWEPAMRLLHFGLLRCAALLVPGNRRAEWSREWQGELWHVRQACAPAGCTGWRGELEVTQFCLGAFQDALCLRRTGPQPKQAFAAMEGTARQCILILVAILAASDGIALLLPGVRAELMLWPRKVNPNLVLIRGQGSDYDSLPSISSAQFRSWTARKQKYFDGFAFYRVTRESVEPGWVPGERPDRSNWGVAHASSNTFALLGLPVRFAEPGRSTEGDLPEVILGEAVWKRHFGAEPRVAGVVMRMGTQMVRIAGVVPDGSLGLPGRVDAWLLEPDSAMGTGGDGYVIAHLTPMGKAEMWAPCVKITANGPDESEDDLLGVSLEEWRPAPETLYGFALFLALLALPAITSVSLGEASANPQKTSWGRRIFRWSFLSAKIALLLPIVYLVSLDLAYGFTTFGRERAVYIQLISTFLMCLFGLRWVLKDQRQRCPVCVRCVTHPAHVGQASRTCLDWNGTEMMCMGGHTLLHVPSLPTSWFSTQRWLYLDTSWGFLFAGSTRQIP
jgi:hypothetical protein